MSDDTYNGTEIEIDLNLKFFQADVFRGRAGPVRRSHDEAWEDLRDMSERDSGWSMANGKIFGATSKKALAAAHLGERHGELRDGSYWRMV